MIAKGIAAIITILVVLIGLALWVQHDTRKEANRRFCQNAVTAYIEEVR